MKIVVGKYYRTRDGRKVGPMKSRGMWGSFFEYNGSIWTADGAFEHDRESKYDLIAEWEDNEHIERTKRMIEVMQAYVDGEKVEYSPRSLNDWTRGHNLAWNWVKCDYRIAEPETHDSINWDHVAPEFKYMARDENGYACLYKSRPELYKNLWIADSPSTASAHASFKRGTIDWKDSLVMRPGCE